MILLTILCYTRSQLLTNTAKLNGKCQTDDQCSPPYIICRDAVCNHKRLFPMTGMEIGALFIMIFLVVLAMMFSLAGGQLIVPIAMIMMGFSAVEAVTLSNSITFLTTLTKYVVGLFLRNPSVEYNTIVDYNSAIILIPPIAFFSTIGGILSAMFPELLLMFIMLALLLFAFVTMVLYIRVLRRQRRLANINENNHHPIDINEQEHHKTILSESLTIHIEPEAEYLVAPGNDHHTENLQATESNNTYTGNQIEREKQKLIEGSNFYWKKFGLILANVIFAILLSIFRGGKGFNSVIGATRCSAGDWIILVLYLLLMAAASLIGYMVIIKEQNKKERIEWKAVFEVKYDTKKYLLATAWTSFSGIAVTLAGVGAAAMLNPMFALLKYSPVTTSWTNNMITMVSKIAAVSILALSGAMQFDYVGFYGFLISFAVIIGENTLMKLIKKKNNQIIIPAGQLMILTISFIITLYIGIEKWKSIAAQGEQIFPFTSYC